MTRDYDLAHEYDQQNQRRDYQYKLAQQRKDNSFYLVSGSDLDKMKEQVPDFILDLAEGVFCCGGNQYYIGDDLVYEHKFEPPDDLLKYLVLSFLSPRSCEILFAVFVFLNRCCRREAVIF